MSVLSIPIKNDFAMQKDIFRFAATLFSENNDIYSALESQLQMVKCIFVKQGNVQMTVDEIAIELLYVYKYHISKDEVYALIQRHRKIFSFVESGKKKYYKLMDQVYSETVEIQKKTIDFYIELYIEEFKIIEKEKCTDAIYKYLYELTTTNINSYKILIYGKGQDKYASSELSVDMSVLEEDELLMVHNFIAWDNSPKNIALGNIVFSCLEYCMLVNGDKPNKLLVDNIRRREIYLDTNIIFRATGINGEPRKQVIESFLKKCVQAKLKLIISHNTKKEFFDTIDYYISQITEYPRGNIYLGAYENISDYNIFSFYENWRTEHPSLPIRFFRMYIQSLYASILNSYNIVDDEKIPKDVFDSDNFKAKRNNYSISIKNKKRELKALYISEDDYYSLKDCHDATVITYIELLRDNKNEDKDIFFVSSDKTLRYWDMTRKDREYPVVIYPSQLFLILLKTCGRSQDDFSSFVSFININPSKHQISAEKANIILSGISSITEDVSSQKLLVSAICEGEFQDIVQQSNADQEFYQKVQIYSQNYLNNELKEKESQIFSLVTESEQKNQKIENLNQKIEKISVDIQEKTSELSEINNELSHREQELEKRRERVYSFAEKKIKPLFIAKWYIMPAIVVIYFIFFLMFILLQFVYCDAPWNFVTTIIAKIADTTFGQNVDGYIAIIDGALFTIFTSLLLPQFWIKPLDANKREKDKQKKIENYIKKNNLL